MGVNGRYFNAPVLISLAWNPTTIAEHGRQTRLEWRERKRWSASQKVVAAQAPPKSGRGSSSSASAPVRRILTDSAPSTASCTLL
eukprot:COSAG02_NODE_8677_length_2483_cov_2.950084_1_plen_84_part_10